MQNYSLVEAVVGVLTLLVTVISILVGWYKNRERRIQDQIDDHSEILEQLKINKISRDEMKEYVELSSKPIINSIEHLVEESRITRQLLERIFYGKDK